MIPILFVSFKYRKMKKKDRILNPYLEFSAYFSIYCISKPSFIYTDFIHSFLILTTELVNNPI